MKLFTIATLSSTMMVMNVFIQVTNSSPLLEETHHPTLDMVKRAGPTTPQPCDKCEKGLVCAQQLAGFDSNGNDSYMNECRVPMGAKCQKNIKCADGFYCGPSGQCDGHIGTPLNSDCTMQTCDHGLYCDHSKKCLKMGG